MKSGAADSFVARHDVPSIFAGHYDPSFTLDLCCKDLGLIAALSQATQTQAPMTAQAQDRFEAARAAFGGDQAELLVCKLIEDASGGRDSARSCLIRCVSLVSTRPAASCAQIRAQVRPPGALRTA